MTKQNKEEPKKPPKPFVTSVVGEEVVRTEIKTTRELYMEREKNDKEN